MKIIIAPDSFKGCLSAKQATLAIERGIRKAVDNDKLNLEIIKVPMADGGEGTVEAIIEAVGGNIIEVNALDPLGKNISSFYGVLPDNTAVIEMAAAIRFESYCSFRKKSFTNFYLWYRSIDISSPKKRLSKVYYRDRRQCNK